MTATARFYKRYAVACASTLARTVGEDYATDAELISYYVIMSVFGEDCKISEAFDDIFPLAQQVAAERRAMHSPGGN